jgi:hypothetical protein
MQRTVKMVALCSALTLAVGSLAWADTTSGKISDVNASAKTFTIRNAKGKSTYTLAKDGRVMVGETMGTFEALKPSEHVTVDWSLDGKSRVASRVEVKPEAKHAAKAATAPAAKSH